MRSGVYRRSIRLASGRFAMRDDRMEFRLAQWKLVFEPRLGRVLTATVSSGSMTWDFGRQREQSIG